MMQYQKLEVGPYGCNCYILRDESSGQAMLIDPGSDRDRIESALEGYTVSLIVLTHGHFDHVFEVPYFRQKYGACVVIHQDDVCFLSDRSLYDPFGMFSEYESRTYLSDRRVRDGDSLAFGSDTFDILSTPGHTPGSMCLYTSGHLFCGDLLFYLSVGRTDFPRGDERQMAQSLKRVLALPADTIVHPGHGPDTTIGRERLQNPYIHYFEQFR